MDLARADELAEQESRQLVENQKHEIPKQVIHKVDKAFKHGKGSSKKQLVLGNKKCFRCGSSKHLAPNCKHKNDTCRYCHKKGHFEKVCFKKQRDSSKGQGHTHHVTTLDSEPASDDEEFTFYINKVDTDPNKFKHFCLPVTVEGQFLNMEIDTGSSVTILNTKDFASLGLSVQSLNPSTAVLKTYTSDTIKCLGEKSIEVQIGDQKDNIVIRVVETKGPSLLGRDIMMKFKLPWKNIFNVSISERDQIIQKFADLFDVSVVGKLKDIQVQMREHDHKPIFFKLRPVPFSILGQYEKALDKLEAEGIIEKVDYLDGASPTVPVLKTSGDLRICGDYSVTINKCSDLEQYPIPTFEELLHKLKSGVKYTKLDLSQAYHQLELAPESRKYTTINTTKGLYQYNRLTFGINSAVSIFQRTMENVLQALPGCCIFVDDILVTGENEEKHKENLYRVLSKLQDYGLKLKKDKFYYMMDEITYLGYTISRNGISPTQEKAEALKQAKPPTNVSELQSFIGMANLLRRFVPDFAKVMSPLYELLCKKTVWCWGKSQTEAFEKIKDLLCSETVLKHYNEKEKLVMKCDASSVGIGAVLLQPAQSGDLQPVAYASRILNSAECNYSQIERESLAIIFGVTKFRQYLLGRHFELFTDHKPLVTLLGEHNGVPQLVSAHIKCWALTLAAYNYTIAYIAGKENVCADFLSRKLIEGEPTSAETVTSNVLFVDTDNIVKAQTVRSETRKDPVLYRVLQFTKNGWPSEVDSELLPFYRKRLELSNDDDVLLWDTRF